MKKRSEILEEQAGMMRRASRELQGDKPTLPVEHMALALICTGMSVIMDELADMRKIGEEKKLS